MSESVLNALMQLFALVAGMSDEKIDKETAKNIVKLYLQTHLSNELSEKYLLIYEQYLKQFSTNQQNKKKKLSASSVKVLKITEKINLSLNRAEKFVVLFRVIEFVNENAKITDSEMDLIQTLAETFKINKKEFKNILHFITENFEQIPEPDNLILVSSSDFKPEYITNNKKFIYEPFLNGDLYILYIKSIETFVFIYNGKNKLKLTGRIIHSERIYIFDPGSIIRGNRIKPIYQTNIASQFLSSKNTEKVRLVAEQIRFKFKNSQNGIHKVSLELESGQLVGIMGGSGVGKSTFLNLLIGKYPLSSGKITINGYDIHSEKNKIQGLIGYVPQDDLLIEELTVYQNLFFNSKLCFGNFTDDQIQEKVFKILKELDLYEIKDLKVGNPLNKFISGGQRKRLNIALELIREPAILFVDEPTSGLSSTDSVIVIDLLKHQALTGKLIVVNIHQPSSDIYKLFDKIWIFDRGGYPVYQGNPIDAIAYFKEAESYADYQEIECPVCGTVHPEEVLEILEEKMVDEFGKYTQQRKTKPQEWYTLFKVNLEKRSRIKKPVKTKIPKTDFKIPSKTKQFLIFVKRDILAKLADKQYLILNILEPPLLAVILAFFSKKISDNGSYIFMENINIPIFLFMSVVVAMFLGLSISAEEIIKDRKILEREKFLNLSRFSYLCSKTFILFTLSAYQMFAYVLISNQILGIKNMLWQYWIVLFSTAALSNMLGLNISSAFKNIVTIYILIPLILVPEMLLGGAMIKYDNIYPALSNKKYVPIIGDLMFTRWAYEALAVEQFKNNKYEQKFFNLDKQKSQAMYICAYLIPELQMDIRKCQKGIKIPKYKQTTQNYLLLINNELNKLMSLPEMKNFSNTYSKKLNYQNFDKKTGDNLINFLDKIKQAFYQRINKINTLKDKKIENIEKKFGQNYIVNLKKDYYNNKLADIVLNKMQVKMFIRYKNELIRKKDPIFTDSDSKCGRAHFYAAEKSIANYTIPTFVFDIIVLWLFTIFLFISLYFEWLKKIVEFLSNLKWKKQIKQTTN
jgi:ABC-type multidrug transport system ATPase subunit